MPDPPRCCYCSSTAHLGVDHPRIRFRHAIHPSQREWEAVVVGFGRWVRLFAAYGSPPGSHIGLWHTDTGAVHGWNLRVGKRYVGPCLTLLAHTRRTRRRTSGERA